MVGLVSRRRLHTLYALGTAVGVAIHELAHKWFAEERDLAVRDVVYFQLGDPAGYVRHETPDSYRALLAVSLAPFLVNTAVAAAAFGAARWLRYERGFAAFAPSTWAVFVLLLWLGIACGVHAFPSRTDLANVGSRTRVANGGRGRLRSWLAVVAGRHWGLWLLVAPIRVLVAVAGTAWGCIRQPGAVLALPLLVVLNACTRTRRYGSHVAYTLVVYWLASLAVEQYATVLIPLLT